MKELASKLSSRKNCDVNRLEEICANFQQSMLQYKHEFAEQKVTLVDDAEMKKKVLSDIRKTLQGGSNNANSGSSQRNTD